MTEPGQTGASGQQPEQTPPATPANPPATPPAAPATPSPDAKLEVRDGKYFINGKSFVAESDLIAAKRSLEERIEQAQTAHNQAIDQSKLQLSESQQEVARLNAKLQENEQARQSGAVTNEEAARVKQDLEAAKGSAEQATAKALEFRRSLLALQYQIPADQLQNKDMQALDSFEEALKALATSRGGPGQYAIPGGSGSPAPASPEDRAKAILANTPIRGVRNEGQQQQQQ